MLLIALYIMPQKMPLAAVKNRQRAQMADFALESCFHFFLYVWFFESALFASGENEVTYSLYWESIVSFCVIEEALHS